jgi:hypothetical protein
MSEEDSARAPKVVRRVVVSYKLGWLPGEWLQAWRRLDRVFAELVTRLEAGIEFTAEKLDPEDEKIKPKIVTYRGHTIID